MRKKKKADKFLAAVKVVKEEGATSQKKEVSQLKATPEIKELSAELILGLIREMGLKEGRLSAQIKKNILATDKLIHHINALDILLILKSLKLDVHKFFKGAHFKIPDNGELYEALSQLPGAEKRFSSHFLGEEKEEIGIHCGHIIPEILILTVKKKAGKDTSHIQTEASSWRGMTGIWKHPHTLKHISDTVWYFMLNLYAKLLTGKPINLGAYGYSEHVDSNPVVVDPQGGNLQIYKEILLQDLKKMAAKSLEETECLPQDSVVHFRTQPQSSEKGTVASVAPSQHHAHSGRPPKPEK